jgi:hypothetical protein
MLLRPNTDAQRFQWGESYWCFVLSIEPRDRSPFQPGPFPSRKRPVDRIVDFMSLAIAGSFHHHEVCIVVLVQDLIVFPHRRCSPSSKIQPRFRIQGIAVAGVAMFINACRNAAILERSLRTEPIKDDPIAVGALDKFGNDLATVCDFIYLDVNGALHRDEVFAGIVEVIPRRNVLHAPDQLRTSTGKLKLAAVIRMFRRFKNTRPFRALGRTKLAFFCINGNPCSYCY